MVAAKESALAESKQKFRTGEAHASRVRQLHFDRMEAADELRKAIQPARNHVAHRGMRKLSAVPSR